MPAITYINGRFLPAEEARVAAFDGGFLHGAGVFETMRAEEGRVFRLERHLARLRRSAAALLRPIEDHELPAPAVFQELLSRLGSSTARLRLTVTAGSMLADPGSAPPTVVLTASEQTSYPAEYRQQGVAVAICPFHVSPTDPVAGHKSTSYLPRLLGLRHAQAAGCFEALWFTTERALAEGSITNCFLVSGGGLRTPPLSTPVLPGITREAVLGLADALGIDARQDALTINDLLDADEVFITNAGMGVMPVIRVERRDIGVAKPGPVTMRLREALDELIRGECRSGG